MEEEDKEENQTLNMNIQITINGNVEIPIFHFIAMSTTQLPRYLNTIRLQFLWPNELPFLQFCNKKQKELVNMKPNYVSSQEPN